jgi:cytoskeleton protein RodZ
MSSDTQDATPSSPENVQASGAPVISPGQMLRSAREARQFSIAELVTQTRLAKATIEALERDDFNELSKPVFVRGYLRKCAKVLDVPEEGLINAYASWTGTSIKPEPLPVTVSEPVQRYADDDVRTLPWKQALVAAIVIGIALWWLGSRSKPETPGEQATTTVLEPASGTGTTTLELPAPSGETLGAAEPAGTDDLIPPAEEQPEEVQPAAPVVAAPPPVEQAPPANTETTLHLNVTNSSWVEITDSAGKRLAYGLLQPGETRALNGRPPYNVLLGNAAGVSMMLGSQPIDLAAHTSNTGTAKLTVGQP